MGRILYGIMGDARGHVNRALIVAQDLSRHEFLFLGGGKVLDLVSMGYAVEALPMASTFYRNNKVDIPRTLANGLRVLLGSPAVVRRVADIIDRFDPDLIVTDYEYFTPLAARKLGRFCVSLDHQHVVTHCSYETPKTERISGLMTGQSIKTLYSKADLFLVTSFFRVPPKDPRDTEVFPPILRRAVTESRPTEGDHILVYQTSPTFHKLLPVLEAIRRKFIIYGLGERVPRKNLVFKAPSTEGFLDDLRSCRYVITNGGHNVVSEALYLGKPVFSFPIANAYEQFLNAVFLARLGYGEYSTVPDPSPGVLQTFEVGLGEYAARIKRENFHGNREIFARLEELMSTRADT
jgi:uncharacterized protein (TIGR00661 family)